MQLAKTENSFVIGVLVDLDGGGGRCGAGQTD